MTGLELSSRKQVWYQLSQLYLDTEFDDDALRRMAAILAQSPYSVAELREIELWEVAPGVYRNMLSVAGEWTGFDRGWINGGVREAGAAARITAPRGRTYRLPPVRSPSHWPILGATRSSDRGRAISPLLRRRAACLNSRLQPTKGRSLTPKGVRTTTR